MLGFTREVLKLGKDRIKQRIISLGKTKGSDHVKNFCKKSDLRFALWDRL